MVDPFEKSIRDLDLQDLRKLIDKTFCESMFIEYKSDMPESKKIAKTIAGFANSHGGYLIIGADRDCGKDEVPKDFPGTTMGQKPKDEIKNICRDHISPMPVYQAKYLEVSASKGILVIQIEESLDTPHINRDGKIYRRQSNSTESIAEDSRGTIDYLYQKGLSGKESINIYLQSKADHFGSNARPYNLFFTEILICPIPIRDLIKDLFDRHLEYGKLLPRFNQSQKIDMDMDCIYQQYSFTYEELNVSGCLNLHYGEEARLGRECSNALPSYYSEKLGLYPDSIKSDLEEGISSANQIYKACSERGFDHFGKIRIKMTLRNIRSKFLFYSDQSRYYRTHETGSRNGMLETPSYDCLTIDLQNPEMITEEFFKHIKHGFNIPF